MTLRECLEQGSARLRQAGVDNSDQEAWYLLEYLLKIDRIEYLMDMHQTVDKSQIEEYQNIVDKRAGHYPLQYITGFQEFMGLEFKVNSNVLIPRQDTETLIEEIVNQAEDVTTVLDMCTGSGCIAISLARFLPSVMVTGVDVSEKALDVARENGSRLAPDVNFVQSDLFEDVSGRYDLIVSNPPYIPSAVCDALMPEVRDHEPRLALDGTEDGLFFYRRIIAQAREFLNENGWLFFEIGYDQGQQMKELLEEYEEYFNIEVKKDLAGLDRIVSARYRCKRNQEEEHV